MVGERGHHTTSPRMSQRLNIPAAVEYTNDMRHPTNDVWEALSTARSIRRFTDEPVDDETLERCLAAATWAPNGANAQLWRFIVLDGPEQRSAVATAAGMALDTIEKIYGMNRPADNDQGRAARNNRATYELHDRAGEYTSVLFTAFKTGFASEYLQAGSIYPAMQNFHLAARAQGLGLASRVGRPMTASRCSARRLTFPTNGSSRDMSSSAGPVDVTVRFVGGPSQMWCSAIGGTPTEPTSSTAEAPVLDAADRRDRA